MRDVVNFFPVVIDELVPGVAPLPCASRRPADCGLFDLACLDQGVKKPVDFRSTEPSKTAYSRLRFALRMPLQYPNDPLAVLEVSFALLLNSLLLLGRSLFGCRADGDIPAATTEVGTDLAFIDVDRPQTRESHGTANVKPNFVVASAGLVFFATTDQPPSSGVFLNACESEVFEFGWLEVKSRRFACVVCQDGSRTGFQAKPSDVGQKGADLIQIARLDVRVSREQCEVQRVKNYNFKRVLGYRSFQIKEVGSRCELRQAKRPKHACRGRLFGELTRLPNASVRFLQSGLAAFATNDSNASPLLGSKTPKKASASAKSER